MTYAALAKLFLAKCKLGGSRPVSHSHMIKHLLSLWIGAALTLQAAEPQTLKLSDFDATSPGRWTQEAGILHLAPAPHDAKAAQANLISKQSYENFALEWEWKIAPSGNNGVKYWVQPIGEKKEWLGIEYQMIDDERHPDAKRKDNHSTACIYDIKGAAADKPVKPAGEWNHSKLVVKSGKLEHWLNGKLVAEADTQSTEWKALIDKSKFKDKAGFAPGKGHLMLTDHQDETWYRNIRLTVQ
jgi:hypothetical protein